ncbi:MAG: very short patch repair endonuclease [Ruminococcus sp.]|nr:very short patch repair endonuclease [Ruminococcus sp.]
MKHQKLTTTPEISKRMGNIRLKRGKAETMLAKRLWHSGYRYRLNYRKLPGSPDIAITRHKVAVFVDGEFWHGQNWEERKPKLKSNREYWIEKIEENIARDKRNNDSLNEQGWSVIRFWEKEVLKDPDGCVEKIITLIE